MSLHAATLSKHFPVLNTPGRTMTSFADENRKRVITTKSTKSLLTHLLSFLMFSAACTTTNGQELRDAFRKVKQSVVIVRTKQVDLAPAAGQVISIIDGLGSGVLISADGKILTAAHIVQTADAAWVEFPDGQVIRAQVIGSDPRSDVALLQLDQIPPGLVPAKLGDSDKLEVGDQIFVVGAPYGISQTLTAGHLSGRHRLNNAGEDSSVEFLQTDAAINRGNSGSPMFGMDGEVVGIMSTIMSHSGGSEGIAFATASNTAKSLLLDRTPFWSGIDGLLITDDLAKALNLPQPAGVLVQRIADNSIGSRLGLRPGTLRATVQGTDMLLGGDVILSLNDIQITDDDYDQLNCAVGALKPGDSLLLEVVREGKVVKLSAPVER